MPLPKLQLTRLLPLPLSPGSHLSLLSKGPLLLVLLPWVPPSTAAATSFWNQHLSSLSEYRLQSVPSGLESRAFRSASYLQLQSPTCQPVKHIHSPTKPKCFQFSLCPTVSKLDAFVHAVSDIWNHPPPGCAPAEFILKNWVSVSRFTNSSPEQSHFLSISLSFSLSHTNAHTPHHLHVPPLCLCATSAVFCVPHDFSITISQCWYPYNDSIPLPQAVCDEDPQSLCLSSTTINQHNKMLNLQGM